MVERLAIYHARRARRSDLIISKIFDVRVAVVNSLQETRFSPRQHACDRWNDRDRYKTMTEGDIEPEIIYESDYADETNLRLGKKTEKSVNSIEFILFLDRNFWLDRYFSLRNRE